MAGASVGARGTQRNHRPARRWLRRRRAEQRGRRSGIPPTASGEAMGIAHAASSIGLPVTISFTVETDGKLPSGETLREAIELVDAQGRPAYFGVNCAHPTHFESCFAGGGRWTTRIRSIRAN